MRTTWKTLHTNESGTAMTLVLVFIAMAMLVVPPVLSYMSTGFKTGMIYEDNTKQLYAAESGVNDGVWYAKYDNFSTLFGTDYKDYDFHSSWNYDLDEPVNGYNVNVRVDNVWLPTIAAPDELQARTIIENGLLMLSGGAPPESTTYRIRLSFFPDGTNDPKIETFGIWLPPGFSYVEGSCNLEDEPTASYYPVSEEISHHASGQAVVWSFWSVPIAEFGPEVSTEGASIISTITFEYTASEEDQRPAAVSWVTTSDAPDVPFTWDADTRIYHITGNAGDVNVEAYVGRSEVRELESALNGDYLAIGNTLMTATWNAAYRDRLFSESSAVVAESALPSTATIQSARLYWSGWIDEIHETVIFQDSGSGGEWNMIWEDDCSSLENWQTLFQDDCSSYSGWTAGADWSIYDGKFRGHHSGTEDDRYLTMAEAMDLSDYSGEEVVISWEQTESGSLEPIDALKYSLSGDGGASWSAVMTAFSDDNPSSPFSYTIPGEYVTDNFLIRFYLASFSESNEYAFIDNMKISATVPGTWNSGNDWTVYNGQFRGHHSGTEEDRYLTLNQDIDLSGYADSIVRISWDQAESGYLESSDALKYALSGDGGETWSSLQTAFYDDNPSSPFIGTIPVDYLTESFRVRFYLNDFADSDEYAYIDNIGIGMQQEGDWIYGADWDIYSNEFRGHHYTDNEETDRYLEMDVSVNLSAYQGTNVQISWGQSTSGWLESEDRLKYAFSANDGITWGSMATAFSGNFPGDFSTTIPDGFLTDGFRLRFYLDGFNSSDEYVFIDNIRISQVDFGVNRVMFNGQEIIADRQQVDQNVGSTYSYSCYYDATELINTMIDGGDLGANGSGTYTLGHVLRLRDDDPDYSVALYPSGTTGYPLGIPDTDTGYGQWAYAGWSLILIYTSPEVDGHQIYLYDDFTYVDSGDTVNLPITGFMAPPDPDGSRLTCFVGEGDPFYTGDYASLNGEVLSDGVNPANNIFNSYSNALDNPSINGIDLDTFDISDYVQAGDTSADFETATPTDVYNIIYIILSFRHDTTYGGTVSYLIRS